MPILTNLAVPLADTGDLVGVAARALGLPRAAVLSATVLRRSVDARGKRPKWVVTLSVRLEGEPPPEDALRPVVGPEVSGRPKRIVIVGTGPAGLFAALRCADARVPCVVLDRGAALKGRHTRARRLRAHGELDPETNLCFGEGGAGTYSDGKLYTRKNDPRVREVYERLVGFGADPAILVDAHPHVGTNELIPVLDLMHAYLVERGVDLRFDSRVDSLLTDGGAVRGVRYTGVGPNSALGTCDLEADAVIFATGHSARDTYAMLASHGVAMTRKPFAVGARVEHPQSFVDRQQFGSAAGHPALGAAEYFLRCQTGDRGVYSFCMCPGGFIIPTPTEPGHLNVNGMSNASRGNHFANAALVVTVNPEDCAPSGDPLDGLVWQRAIERKAFLAGGSDYSAPATRLSDFARGRGSTTLPARTSYRPALVAADVADVLPDFVSAAIRTALAQFDRQMRGYITDEAVIVAAETTTSSPIRIERLDNGQSPSLVGLYPAGEGAGYAGGIVSSAIDGMNAVEQALRT